MALKAQQTALIHGLISNTKGIPIERVAIIIKGTVKGTSSLPDGTYSIEVPANKKITLLFSHINSTNQQHSFLLFKKEIKQFNLQLTQKKTNLSEVHINAHKREKINEIIIDKKLLGKLPVTSSGAVEQLVKTLPGVTSNNEFSSQYSVRGGNYDENLVYINDIEIYRPHLVRSGQQEGLSIINPDMVSSIRFSPGGFDAKYGDKMSSVLDIRYKIPSSYEASFNVSMMGATAHVANQIAGGKLSFITGLRYKTNQYLLNSLDTKGNYKPSYSDIQTLVNYRLSSSLSANLWYSISRNNYLFEPENRETTFGTINQALKLKIYFDGQEKDKYLSRLAALSLNYQPNDNNLIKFIISQHKSTEQEQFDIKGQYYLNELFITQGGDQDESINNLGIGTYLNHARNKLDMNVTMAQVKGFHNINEWTLQWGVTAKRESIKDHINEWQYRDSAGYSIPFSETRVMLASSRNAHNNININHIASYAMATKSINGNMGELRFTTGIRSHFWKWANKVLVSPRASIHYMPKWNNNLTFHLTTGYYGQIPSYRQMLTLDGEISASQTIQRSIHYTFGQEYFFKAWERPFRFSSQIYYKDLQRLIPYEIDNVRIRYYGDQQSKGYSTGIDLRVNGEFVPGTESWASLSLMKSQEDIEGDGKGYLARPTDQRFNFAMFFQDYLPRNPSYRMQLTLFYGSRLPFWAPKTGKQGGTLKMPPYRRVDLGFSKVLIDKKRRSYNGLMRHFKSLWVGLEIFNLLNINNTVSYLWVNDIHNNQYAIPNYLTSRKINIKISASF